MYILYARIPVYYIRNYFKEEHLVNKSYFDYTVYIRHGIRNNRIPTRSNCNIEL